MGQLIEQESHEARTASYLFKMDLQFEDPVDSKEFCGYFLSPNLRYSLKPGPSNIVKSHIVALDRSLDFLTSSC